jgi:hypothetical protein
MDAIEVSGGERAVAGFGRCGQPVGRYSAAGSWTVMVKRSDAFPGFA